MKHIQLFEEFINKESINHINEQEFEIQKNTYQDFDTMYINRSTYVQVKMEGSSYLVRCAFGQDRFYLDTAMMNKIGLGYESQSGQVGQSYWLSGPNWKPVKMTKSNFDKLLKTLSAGFSSYGKSFADFYKNRSAD